MPQLRVGGVDICWISGLGVRVSGLGINCPEPLIPKSESQIREIVEMSLEDAREEKILVVDDSALQRGEIRDSLLKNGYLGIWECKGGIEAVIKHKMLKPSLLIICVSDLMDLEVIKSVLEKNPLAKILVVGAEGSESYIGEAVRLGAQEYLIRPYKQEALLTIVKGMIR